MAKKAQNAATPTPAMDRDWQAEGDYDTLNRAREIQGDRTRMTGVRRHARKELRRAKRCLGGSR